MTVRLTEAKLRQIVREEILESMGGMNPRGLEMTRDEVMIQQKLMNFPGTDRFLNALARATRAELGAHVTSAAVGDLLRDQVKVASASASDIRESEHATEFLKGNRDIERDKERTGYTQAGLSLAAGGLGLMLMKFAAESGTPVDDLIQYLQYVLPLMFAGGSVITGLEAQAAGRNADQHDRILRGQKNPAMPVRKLELPRRGH